MTITHRKRAQLPDEIQVVNEPGLQIQCDSCDCDLTHSIRIKCADPVCENGDGIDICPTCFCAGKEFKQHKQDHNYRVVELHSYPIFVDDWGADEELLLIEGITLQGLGNWQAVSEHVGTRTKEEVEEHYNAVYINSPHWPLPERKRRRISSMSTAATVPKAAPTSAPGVHEIATFLPGRLEFEHEVDNEAEDLVKDLEFGICLDYGGDQIAIDDNDNDVVARAKLDEERGKGKDWKDKEPHVNGTRMPGGLVNGYHIPNGDTIVKRETQATTDPQDNSEAGADSEEPTLPPPIETSDSLNFKLTLLEMYAQRVEKRVEVKTIIFDRGLLEYKKMQAQEKKRPKEEKDIAHRLRPLAKLQTADDYEKFVEGIIYESALRKRIQELQHYRRMGLTTAAEIEKYEADVVKRAQVRASIAQGYPIEKLPLIRVASSRGSMGPDPRRSSVTSMVETEAGDNLPRTQANSFFRRQPAPLNLANSPSLHLLTPAEQTLCSTLRILPKPYLVMKETLVREYARRGGKLRRREARDLIKIDVNKTSKVWDFLVQAGFLKAPPPEPVAGHGETSLDGNSAQVNSSPRGMLPTAPSSISPMSSSARDPGVSSSSIAVTSAGSWPSTT
ncbi:hypothetical protein BD410DRAFT_825937 [Rickenella mellea]|uniref:Transcriptional adapter 2 n=1 Tax=Rickenella mellea TaxID=50990 RepID=A0A4Y7QF91_9AGAM|nr:hypothetical protein BD410DRAFT_825937 [Rickenella mellea]